MSYSSLLSYVKDIAESLSSEVLFVHGRQEVIEELYKAPIDNDTGIVFWSLPFTSSGTFTEIGQQVNEEVTVDVFIYKQDYLGSELDQNDPEKTQDEIQVIQETKDLADEFLRQFNFNELSTDLGTQSELLEIQSFNIENSIKENPWLLTGTVLSIQVLVPDEFDYCATNDIAPSIQGLPTISGTEIEGQTLTVTPASVIGNPTPTNTFQWERSGTPILGAVNTTYVLQAIDVGETITVVQTATNSGGSDSAESNPTSIIVVPSPPFITGVPTISGTETEGETLTATPASVSGAPTPTRTWQWERSGVPIAGATSQTYLLVSADVGESLTVVQTETNSEGSDNAESAPTGIIAGNWILTTGNWNDSGIWVDTELWID